MKKKSDTAMHTRYIALGISFVLLGSVVVTAHAQERRPFDEFEERHDEAYSQEDWKEHIKEMRAEREERREEMRDSIAERKSDIRERLEQKRDDKVAFKGERKERVEMIADKIFNRFEAALDRQLSFADRIEEKIAAFDERGADVTDAGTVLGDARDAIEDADEKLAALEAAFDEALEDESGISKESMRAMVTEVKDAIKSAHALLAETLTQLKASISEDDDNEE